MAFVTVTTLEQLHDGAVLKVQIANQDLLIYLLENRVQVDCE